MRSEEDSVPATGQGTEPATEAKEAAKARRLANLCPPFKKGESGNPTGINGRGKANEIAAFLDKPESIESNRTRFEAVVDRLYHSARHGDTQAARVLIEYVLGKPRTTPNALELAEHLRRVERDRIDIALDVVGARIHTAEPAKLKEIFQSCERDTRGFLVAAEQFANGEDSQDSQQAQDEATPAEQAGQPEDGRSEHPGSGAEP